MARARYLFTFILAGRLAVSQRAEADRHARPLPKGAGYDPSQDTAVSIAITSSTPRSFSPAL